MGKSCDEFPLFATEQGFQGAVQDPGLLPSLELITTAHNTRQGSLYGAFTTKCRMEEKGETRPSGGPPLERGDAFIALPIPLPSFPTVWTLCNGKTE